MEKKKLTSLEKQWILYDVGNSAFILLVSTILPIYFNSLCDAAGIAEVDYLAYWGYAASVCTLIVALSGPVLGTIAEQERETIRRRQAEGIEAAKAKGKKLGRPALTFPKNWDEVYAAWKEGKITAKAAMEQTGTKRTSFYKLAGKMK